MPGSAARDSSAGAVTFTAMTLATMSGSTSANGAYPLMPALLTSIATSSAAARSATRATPAASQRSATSGSARTPCAAPSSAASSSIRSCRLATRTRSDPRSASRRANTVPMPADAPVTIALLMRGSLRPEHLHRPLVLDLLRDGVRDVRAGEPLDDPQREVDARRHAACGQHVAVVDDARLHDV